MTPSTGNTNPPGARNGRTASGRLMRSMMIAAHTTMKANSVPIDVISPTTSMRSRPANTATTTPVMMVVMYGVPKRGCTLLMPGGSKLVAAHRKEDAGLAHEHDQQHAGDPGDGPCRDEAGRPVHAEHAQDIRHGRVQEAGALDGIDRGHPGQRGRVGAEGRHVDDAREHQRDRDVEHRADDERRDDADGQVALAGSWPLRRSSTRHRTRCRRRTPPHRPP